MLTITDQLSDQTTTCETFDIAATIGPWYPSAPVAVTTAVADLETAALRGEPTDQLEAFLAVTIDR